MFIFRLLNPVANVVALGGAVGLVVKHRGLVAAMTARELTDRYAGQVLGAAWAILAPLLTMLIYVWVFTFVFKSRLGNIEDTTAFTAYALAGLATWVSLSDGISRAVGVITNNGNLVKQIVFPVEVLPLKVVLASFPTLAIGLILAIGASWSSGLLDVQRLLLLLPVAILTYFFLLAGLAYALAAFGVFLRDLKDIVTFLLGVGMFLNPIIYPPGGAPPWLSASFNFSPIASLIYAFHDAIVGPVDPPNYAWVVAPLSSIVIFVLGWRVFRLLKPTFGNAL